MFNQKVEFYGQIIFQVEGRSINNWKWAVEFWIICNLPLHAITLSRIF